MVLHHSSVDAAATELALPVDSPTFAMRFPSVLLFLGLAPPVLFFLFQRLYLLAKHWRLSAIVEECAHLAHEIHDTLAQGFAGIGYQLQAIRNSIPPNAAALQRQVDLALELVRQSHDETRPSIAS